MTRRLAVWLHSNRAGWLTQSESVTVWRPLIIDRISVAFSSCEPAPFEHEEPVEGASEDDPPRRAIAAQVTSECGERIKDFSIGGLVAQRLGAAGSKHSKLALR